MVAIVDQVDSPQGLARIKMPPPRRTSPTFDTAHKIARDTSGELRPGTAPRICLASSRLFRRHVPVAGRLAVATLCVASWVLCSAKAQTPLLWGSLKPGPHAVGFRLQYKLDHPENTIPEFITDTTRFPVHRPRPIMIGIWYPAQKTNASPMPYRQYLDISPGPTARAIRESPWIRHA